MPWSPTAPNLSLSAHVRSFRFITHWQLLMSWVPGWSLVSCAGASSLRVTCDSQPSSPVLELLSRFCWTDLAVTPEQLHSVRGGQRWDVNLSPCRPWDAGHDWGDISENVLINHQPRLVAEQGWLRIRIQSDLQVYSLYTHCVRTQFAHISAVDCFPLWMLLLSVKEQRNCAACSAGYRWVILHNRAHSWFFITKRKPC